SGAVPQRGTERAVTVAAQDRDRVARSRRDDRIGAAVAVDVDRAHELPAGGWIDHARAERAVALTVKELHAATVVGDERVQLAVTVEIDQLERVRIGTGGVHDRALKRTVGVAAKEADAGRGPERHDGIDLTVVIEIRRTDAPRRTGNDGVDRRAKRP